MYTLQYVTQFSKNEHIHKINIHIKCKGMRPALPLQRWSLQSEHFQS